MSRLSGKPTPDTITDFRRAAEEGAGLGRTIFSGIDFGSLTVDNLSDRGKRALSSARTSGQIQGDTFSLLELIDAGLDSKDLLDKQTRNVAIREGLAERRSKDFKSRTHLEETFGTNVDSALRERFEKTLGDTREALLGGVDAIGEGLGLLTGKTDSATAQGLLESFREQFGRARAASGATPTGELDFASTTGGIEALQRFGLNAIAGGGQAIAGAQAANPFLNPAFTTGLEQSNFQQQLGDFLLRFQINEAHRARRAVSPTNTFLNRVRDFGTGQLFKTTDILLEGLVNQPLRNQFGLAGDGGDSPFDSFFKRESGDSGRPDFDSMVPDLANNPDFDSMVPPQS